MRLRISIRGRVRPSVRLSVCPVLFSKVKSTHTRRILCRVSGLVETEKSSEDITNNGTVSDDEVVASDVPPRYLFIESRNSRCNIWGSTQCSSVSLESFQIFSLRHFCPPRLSATHLCGSFWKRRHAEKDEKDEEREGKNKEKEDKKKKEKQVRQSLILDLRSYLSSRSFKERWDWNHPIWDMFESHILTSSIDSKIGVPWMMKKYL